MIERIYDLRIQFHLPVLPYFHRCINTNACVYAGTLCLDSALLAGIDFHFQVQSWPHMWISSVFKTYFLLLKLLFKQMQTHDFVYSCNVKMYQHNVYIVCLYVCMYASNWRNNLWFGEVSVIFWLKMSTCHFGKHCIYTYTYIIY